MIKQSKEIIELDLMELDSLSKQMKELNENLVKLVYESNKKIKFSKLRIELLETINTLMVSETEILNSLESLPVGTVEKYFKKLRELENELIRFRIGESTLDLLKLEFTNFLPYIICKRTHSQILNKIDELFKELGRR